MALLVVAVQVHRQRACTLGEWPEWNGCPVGAAVPQGDALRAQIARNPGNAGAYLALAVQAAGADQESTLRAAAAVAPNDINVLRLSALRALEQGRVEDAVPHLVLLTEHYHHYSPQSAEVLAQLLADGRGARLLRPHLQSASRWPAAVLQQMLHLRLALGPLLPLVLEGSPRKMLSDADLGRMAARLQENGEWMEAYALWVARHGGSAPLLFNAGFDLPFEADGFDWEVRRQPASRSGARVDRRAFPGRGSVLQAQFTGRALAPPLAQQFLYLAPGIYRIRGEYMTRSLRSERGLAWVARCTRASARDAGRSDALRETGGHWMNFQLTLRVAPDCGPVVKLQLETFDPLEATTGLTGQASFDAFVLDASVR
jgi:hypothetical protein